MLRGVESGGSNRDIGRYVMFCDWHGEPVPWLQPIDTVANKRPPLGCDIDGLYQRDAFRMRNTYDLRIPQHRVAEAGGTRGRIESKVIYRGR